MVRIQAGLREGTPENPQENRFLYGGNQYSSNVTEQDVCLLSPRINPYSKVFWKTGLNVDSRGRCR